METNFPEKTTHGSTIPEEQRNLKKKSLLDSSYRGKPWWIALVTAGLLILTIGIYLGRKRYDGQPEVLETLTIPVKTQNIVVRITASGAVQPIQRVNLSPKNQGRLAELYVKQGDRVQAGQIMARMESRDLEAKLRQAQARLKNSKANLAKQETGSRPEEIAAARARLSQVGARLSQLQAGSRQEEIAVARARLDGIQANLSQLQAGKRPEEIAQGKARLEQAITRWQNAKTGSLKEEIEQAKARIEAAKAELELTTKRLERYQKLVNEGAITRDAYEEYVRDDRRVNANLQEAEKRLEQLTQFRLAEIERLTAAMEEEKQAFQLLEKGTRLEEIVRAEAEVAEARSQLEQLVNGTRPEEIVRAEAEVVEARSQLEQLVNGTRPEEIARAEAEVAEAKAQVRYQEILLEETKVRAPFSGVITQRYASQGAFVTPATSASNATFASSTSIVALARGLEVLAKVPEANIGQITSGQTVEVVADAYPDQVFKGKVKLIAPEAIVERNVTLFEVEVALETGKEKLRSGMNVDLQFLGDRFDNALVVPTVAIVTKKGETGVLVPDAKNQPKFRPITLGFNIGNQIQVLQGIKAGDLVFIELPEDQKLDDIFGDG
ncbi:MAG: efflux RND transporter periplasmic adaptor subunit [Trichodesmium sp. St5_bin2_1]|nr:efflux RND transporter periplasmic adaptor subunit [Trichodesmium sp. St5_bin2_1]